MYVHEAVAVERLRLSTAGCARHCLTAASGRHGLTMKSNKWGGWGGVEIAPLLPPTTVSPVLPVSVGQGAAVWRYVRE